MAAVWHVSLSGFNHPWTLKPSKESKFREESNVFAAEMKGFNA